MSGKGGIVYRELQKYESPDFFTRIGYVNVMDERQIFFSANNDCATHLEAKQNQYIAKIRNFENREQKKMFHESHFNLHLRKTLYTLAMTYVQK